MVNEDIVTALKNAINYGDSLESAKQILVNSGYNAREVEEASKFVGGGSMAQDNQPKPDEELTMPTQKKGFFSRLFSKKPKNTPSSQPKAPTSQHKAPAQTQKLQKQQVTSQQLKQEVAPESFERTIQQVNQHPVNGNKFQVNSQPLRETFAKKPGHLKEIILLFILLAFIGVLIGTILLRDTILSWFSG